MVNMFRISAIAAIIAFFSISHASYSQSKQVNWTNYGKDFHNTRHNSKENDINRYNVDSLIVKWQKLNNAADLPPLGAIDPNDPSFPIESRPAFGEVAGNPVVVGDIVYTADTAGKLTARRTSDGTIIWRKDAFLDYSKPGKTVLSFKASPVVKGDYIIIGGHFQIFSWVQCPDMDFNGQCVPYDGAILLKIDRHNGELVWSKKLLDKKANSLRGSVSIANNTIFVPISSVEEEFNRVQTNKILGGDGSEPYPCCNFNGGVAAVDFDTGQTKWLTPLSPANDIREGILEGSDDVSFTGVSVWHHAPTIDKKRGLIYVGTSNNHSAPQKAIQCERARLDPENHLEPDFPDNINCNNLNDKVKNYVTSLVALDMHTGEVKWVFRIRPYDAWNHGCAAPDFYLGSLAPGTFLNNPPSNIKNCPALAGPDFGFSMPILIKNVKMPGKGRRDVLMGTDKSGLTVAINPDNGKPYYDSVKVGPGGILGGVNFAPATDGKTWYGAVRNSLNEGKRFDPENIPVLPNPVYNDPLLLNSGENQFNTASGPNTFNSLIGGTYLESGAGYDGNVPDGRWALINPPQDAFDRADGISNTIVDGKLLTTSGFFTAVDIATGKIKWQTPIRTGGRSPLIADVDCGIPGTCGPGALPFNSYSEYLNEDKSGPGVLDSPVTVANGVLFISVADGDGDATDTSLVALDAEDGTYLYTFSPKFSGTVRQRTGSGRHGITVVNGEVYFGGGFNENGVVTGFITQGIELKDNKMYALCLDQNDDGKCDSNTLKTCIKHHFKQCVHQKKHQCHNKSEKSHKKCIQKFEAQCHKKAENICKFKVSH